MLGAIIGDIVGAPFEFGHHRSKSFDLFSDRSSFTDDTICLVAVADALLADADPAERLRTWCRRYPTPTGGYGARFRGWIFDSSMGPYRSKGNGAAMRIAPVAFLARDESEVVRLTRRVTEVTHNHPDAIRGAEATALAIWMARHGASQHTIRMRIERDYALDLSKSVEDIRAHYQYSELCLETVPEAITCALRAADFEDALRNAISLGGDADTLAAIAGGIAEPLYGIPDQMEAKARSYLDQALLEVLYRFNERLARIQAGNPAAR